MKTYTMNDWQIQGSAYNEALKEVAEVINEAMGTNFFYRRDWVALEEVATRLGVRFNEDGEIVR